MLSNKTFFLLLLITIIGGIIFTGYSFIELKNLKNSEEYLGQIAKIQKDIRREKREINKIKKEYKLNPDISTLEYYMALVKQFKYLVRGSYEIDSFSLNFLKNNKHRKKLKKRNGKNVLESRSRLNLLSSYLVPYKGNKYIKSLSLITTFKLTKNSKIDINSNTLNFFKLYKPLIYLYYLKKNKPIIIKTINYSNNNYNIYMQILGK